MSKRFTDTMKWDDIWYRKLPVEYKCFWQYICDKSDISGIWKVDIDAASFFVGEDLNVERALKYFNEAKERIEILNNGALWHIIQFISFQYGKLSWDCKAHQGIFKLIQAYTEKGYFKKDTLTKGLGNPCQRVKDKDKEKDKEMDKEEEEGECEGEKQKNEQFEKFWALYPNRNGKKLLKAEAKKYFIAKIKDEEFLQIMQAVQNYANSTGCRNGYAKDAIRFLRNNFWCDWLEPEKSQKPKGAMSILIESIQEDEDAKRRNKKNDFVFGCGLPEPEGKTLEE